MLEFGLMDKNQRAIHFLENWGELSDQELREWLPIIWQDCEYPGYIADYEEWENIFEELPFCSDDGTPRPTDYKERITIYRAAAKGYEIGISWTTNLETAKWFNERNHFFGFKDSKVYKSRIPKGMIMGIFNKRDEKEIVTDRGAIEFFGIEEV